MTVTSTVVGQIKPGRFEDALAMGRAAAKPLERLGAHNVRLLRGAVAMEAYSSFIITMEYESNQAWGEAYDRIMGDDEILSLMSAGEAEQAPMTNIGVVTAVEIPLGCPTGQGRFILTSLSRPLPGRFEDAVALSARVGEAFTRQGAAGSRLFWQGTAGSQSGTLILTAEYPNMATLGRGADLFLGDDAGKALLEDAFGAGSPVAVLSEEIYAELAL